MRITLIWFISISLKGCSSISNVDYRIQYHKLSMHLICVGSDNINKIKSMLKPAAKFLQHCTHCEASWHLQPYIWTIRQNDTTHLLSWLTVDILHNNKEIITTAADKRQTSQVTIIFLFSANVSLISVVTTRYARSPRSLQFCSL